MPPRPAPKVSPCATASHAQYQYYVLVILESCRSHVYDERPNHRMVQLKPPPPFAPSHGLAEWLADGENGSCFSCLPM